MREKRGREEEEKRERKVGRKRGMRGRKRKVRRERGE